MLVIAGSVGADVTCGTNRDSSNTDICWTLKWHCHDPVANGYVDMSSTSCSTEQWDTIDCCYAENNGAGCDRSILIDDGDQILNEWYQSLQGGPGIELNNFALTNNNIKHSRKTFAACDSIHSQLFGLTDMCVAKDSMTSVELCGIMKYYCHGQLPLQPLVPDVCLMTQWTSMARCYAVDGGAGFDHDTLLKEANMVADYWYRVKSECNTSHYNLIHRDSTN